MQENDSEKQESREPRNEQINIKVTRTEKQALRFVSSALDVTEAELIHGRVIPQIVEEAERLRAKLAEVA